jgi:putative transposase
MPRQARVIIPNTPHHIVQRGHNRQVVFTSDDDFSFYKENLTHYKEEFGCKVYAYCFMSNHVHLLIDPGDEPESISLTIKRVAGRQTRYVNKLKKRTGSLWEGRFKSSVVSTQEYLLVCCRYIELNPLRAAMVSKLSEYRWSSYTCKTNGQEDKLIDFDSQYMGLGNNALDRQSAYKKFMKDSIPESELKVIREALQRGQLTGSEKFRREILNKHGVRVSNKDRGRPNRRGQN